MVNTKSPVSESDVPFQNWDCHLHRQPQSAHLHTLFEGSCPWKSNSCARISFSILHQTLQSCAVGLQFCGVGIPIFSDMVKTKCPVSELDAPFQNWDCHLHRHPQPAHLRTLFEGSSPWKPNSCASISFSILDQTLQFCAVGFQFCGVGFPILSHMVKTKCPVQNWMSPFRIACPLSKLGLPCAQTATICSLAHTV